jgi:hypothetical protein
MSDKRWYAADALGANLANHHLRAASEEVERKMRKRYRGRWRSLCCSRVVATEPLPFFWAGRVRPRRHKDTDKAAARKALGGRR